MVKPALYSPIASPPSADRLDLSLGMVFALFFHPASGRCPQAFASPLPPGCPHCVIRSRGLWLARLKCLWHFKFQAKPETADGRFCESSAALSEYHYPHHASWRSGPAAGLTGTSVDRSPLVSGSSRRDALARGGAPRFTESSRAGRVATDFASGKVTF